MRFQLLSDLHLEFAPFDLEKADGCEVLILAGDIAPAASDEYFKFLSKASEMFEKVLVVAGNHECYGHTVKRAFEIISKMVAQFPNVVFLNDSSIDLGEDVRVAGTTLWTDISDEQRSDVAAYIHDFRQIKEHTVETHNAKHRKAVLFLAKEMTRAVADGKSLVVVTHHAPYERGTSAPQEDGSSLSSAFSTDLSDLIRAPIVMWAFGHTHYSSRQTVAGVLLISNQRGYPKENTGFDGRKSIEIPWRGTSRPP
jgi:predicted phosphodiesterase